MSMYRVMLSDEHGIIEWNDNTINIEDTKDDLKQGESYEWVTLNHDEQVKLYEYLKNKLEKENK